MSDDTVRAKGSSKHTAASPATIPPEVEEAARNPANRFGKYILVRELGHGGMGVVYLAWQSDLRRFVALKFIRGIESADDLARFEREARTAAGLVHPNIVPVYEVGELDGKHYYSMMFVRGRALESILRDSPPPKTRAVVELLAGALDACHHANEQGVIHRDIKPANLMLGEDGRVYVMDFGLARQQARGSSLTASGLAVGTPAYMPPEQAAGRIHAVDGRSDVYSFGATLFEALTGRPPFEGTSLDILVAVMQDDPPAPRKLVASIAPDLETICLRAMDKDPVRRYPSCADFAADLRRWLDGEMILARPAGAMSKAVRRIKKNKLLSSLVAFAVLAGFAALGFFAWAQIVARRAAEQQAGDLEKRKTLDQLRLRVQAAAQKIDRWDENLLKPVHDITASYPQLEESMREITELRGARTDLPEADFALGKALRRLGRPDQAVERFTAALAAAPGFAPAFYERGRARLECAFVRDTLMYEPPAVIGDRLKASRFLEEARADLAEALRLGSIGREQLVLGEAIIALCSGKLDEAAEICTRAIKEGSSEADFFILRGRSYVMIAQLIKSIAGSREALAAGLADLRKAVDFRRSDYDLLNDLAFAAYVAAWCDEDSGVDPRAAIEEGRSVAARMRVIRPADPRATWRELEFLDHLLDHCVDRNLPIEEPAARAAALIDEAARLGVSTLLLDHERATLECWLAQAALRNGQDPRERIDRAVALFEKTRRPDGQVSSAPNFATLLSMRMRVRIEAGDYDIEDDYRAGLSAFEALGRELRPLYDLPARANLHELYSMSLEGRGRDPLPVIDRAVDDLKRAAEVLPDGALHWGNLANAYARRAERVAGRGGDAGPDLDLAFAAFETAIRIKPDLANAYNNRGGAHQTAAAVEADAGRDPSAHMKAALADFSEAIRLSPGVPDPLLNRGSIFFEAAARELHSGGDPDSLLDLAGADYEAACKAAPRSPVAWMNAGLVHSLRADWFVRSKRDPAVDLDAATTKLEQALALNPNYLDARQELAGVFVTRAAAASAAKKDPVPDLERAIAEYTKVVDRAPDHALALNNRGLAWNDLARRRMAAAKADAFAAGARDFTSALRVNPKNWRALANRATSWKGLGEWAKALADLEAAVKINPSIMDRYKGEIERLRALTGGE